MKQFVRIGDSKLIEDSNKIVRNLEQHDQDSNVAGSLSIYQRLTCKEVPLQWRGIRHVQVDSDDYYESGSKRGQAVLPWTDMFRPESTPERADWHLRDILQTAQSPFASKSTDGQNMQVLLGQPCCIWGEPGRSARQLTLGSRVCSSLAVHTGERLREKLVCQGAPGMKVPKLDQPGRVIASL